ncbi:Rossmann-like and DUF2520 domain-containing protein [Frankia sp. R43]|uniref:Rossmann-like and DUF2520 domain-containing protein n=1 Tax=Frankia sp. R43 TaxID=269536 RepID=UPI0009F91859|nr:DUF2520 domain-containing protein [Frankia sp. R43]
MESMRPGLPVTGQPVTGQPITGLSIAIVGPGRAGAAVGRALVTAGHQVRAIHSRTQAGRERAAALFPAAEICVTPAQAAALADVVLLGVPDDSIEQTAARIAPGVARTPAVLVAHLSGRHGIAPLAPAAEVGARPAAIHPIMTLTGAATDPDRLVGATFGVTTAPGDEDTAGLVRRLVEGIGGRVAVIPEERRASYHAALVLGGNFLATLVTAAGQLLAAAGVPDPAQALGPLLRMSLDNALAHGEDAMTGPVRRGDVGTVTAQWSELTRRDPHLADAYGALAVLTADRLERSGLLPARTAAALRAGVARPDDSPHGP